MKCPLSLVKINGEVQEGILKQGACYPIVIGDSKMPNRNGTAILDGSNNGGAHPSNELVPRINAMGQTVPHANYYKDAGTTYGDAYYALESAYNQENAVLTESQTEAIRQVTEILQLSLSTVQETANSDADPGKSYITTKKNAATFDMGFLDAFSNMCACYSCGCGCCCGWSLNCLGIMVGCTQYSLKYTLGMDPSYAPSMTHEAAALESKYNVPKLGYHCVNMDYGGSWTTDWDTSASNGQWLFWDAAGRMAGFQAGLSFEDTHTVARFAGLDASVKAQLEVAFNAKKRAMAEMLTLGTARANAQSDNKWGGLTANQGAGAIEHKLDLSLNFPTVSILPFLTN